MAPSKTRCLLVVTPGPAEPVTIAVFGVRADGQLEESSTRHPHVEQVRTMLTTGWDGKPATRKAWEERFVYLGERNPRHDRANCEVFYVPNWVTPSLFHALFYLLDTVEGSEQTQLYADALEAFASDRGASAQDLRSLDTFIPVDPAHGVVPAITAAIRAFRYLTGQLPKERLQELELLEIPVAPAED